MNMNKEKWIDDVINSLDGVQPAEANPYVYTKILSKINTAAAEYAPAKLVWLAAASFILLLLLNFQVIRAVSSSSKNTKTEMQEHGAGYQLLNTNPINYDSYE